MNLRLLVMTAVLGMALIANPVLAQHQGHTMPVPSPAANPAPAPMPMPTPEPPAPSAPSPNTAQGMEGMDHSTTDHSTMEGGTADETADASPGPNMETPPPPEAGSGPPRAADAIWGADAMRSSREDLRRTHGSFPVFWFQGDRLESQMRQSRDGFLWDLQGYYGDPTDRLWFKTEGEGSFGDRVADAEFQALYSRAIAPFWDLQAGVRQDLAGPNTTHGVIGIQGLAPYIFEVDASLFVSHRGDVTARIEAEVDQRITRRLVFQPRAELSFAAQDIARLGIGAGLDTVAIGARLRYAFVREFAPYIGVEQSWRIGSSADFARARGEDPCVTNYVIGVRFWF